MTQRKARRVNMMKNFIAFPYISLLSLSLAPAKTIGS